MRIQRYLLKRPSRGDHLGNYREDHRWSFSWYQTEDKIGIMSRASTEAKQFIDDFLGSEDVLIIDQNDLAPSVRRASLPFAVVGGIDASMQKINDLLRLLQSGKEAYAYLSSLHRSGGDPTVLTFARQPPSPAFYKSGKIMRVYDYWNAPINPPGSKREK